MNMLRTLALSLALMFVGLPSAMGASSALDSDTIQRFLDSMPDVQKLAEKYPEDPQTAREEQMAMQNEYGAMAQSPAMTGPSEEQLARVRAPFTSSLGEMRASEGYDEMVATVKRHGFDGVEQWAEVGDRAMRAYGASKMAAEMPKIEAEMKKLRENLAKSGMPIDQQKAMAQMMDSSSQMLSGFENVPEADKKAIEPFIPRFDKLAEEADRKTQRRHPRTSR
ncbi:MAG: hypothetical protein GY944_03350 [bacterium]|nr:hypothetical protein [bacterium]